MTIALRGISNKKTATSGIKPPPTVLIAGTRSGAGKTTVTLSLLALLKAAGLAVRPFKVGPDYIDSYFHKVVTGESSINLDPYLMKSAAISGTFASYSNDADACVVEGVMGLFDGHRKKSRTSSASVAAQLNIPVILVLDCSKIGQSIAAEALGYTLFDPSLKFVGIVLNNVAGESHLSILRSYLDKKMPPIVGVFMRTPKAFLSDVHLGLDRRGVKRNVLVSELLNTARSSFDLGQIGRIFGVSEIVLKKNIASQKTNTLQIAPISQGTAPLQIKRPKIAIAYDDAFFFYYAQNIDLLLAGGCEVTFFSPLKDKSIPRGTDMIYFGGGYPEHHGEALAGNKDMINEIKRFYSNGGFIYAECGGLVYLSESLKVGKKSHKLVGLLPQKIEMQDRRVNLGYADAIAASDSFMFAKGDKISGHRFHWSKAVSITPGDGQIGYSAAYEIAAQFGKKKHPQQLEALSYSVEGMASERLVASYLHLNFASYPNIIKRVRRDIIEKRY